MAKAKRKANGQWPKGQSGSPEKVWPKGKSGNPDGSTAEEQAARVAMKRGLAGMVDEALAALRDLLASTDERVKLGAVRVVAENVIGKDPAPVQTDMPTTIVIDGLEIRPRVPPPAQDEARA